MWQEFEIPSFFMKQATKKTDNFIEQWKSSDYRVFHLLVIASRSQLMDNSMLVSFALICKKCKYEIPTEQKIGA